MNLPKLDNPQNYIGLYIYDFGDRVAVGYTADEVAMLQAAPEHAAGRVFRIHHAEANGQLLLRGASRLEQAGEEGMIFFQDGLHAASDDFEDLKARSLEAAPPCPLHWHMARDEQLEHVHFTLLSYDARHSEAVGRWLLAIGFSGGLRVDCGRRVVTYYREGDIDEVERVAIAPHPRWRSRPLREVLASVDQPVQRDL